MDGTLFGIAVDQFTFFKKQYYKYETLIYDCILKSFNILFNQHSQHSKNFIIADFQLIQEFVSLCIVFFQVFYLAFI